MLPESYARLEDVVLPAARWLRENLPLGRSDLEEYGPVWLLSKHGDQMAVARNQDLFYNGDFPHLQPKAGVEYSEDTASKEGRIFDYPSYFDPPEHGLYRNALGDYFQPAVVRRRFEELFRTAAKNAVDKLMALDGECDFVNDFAVEYPLRVIMAVLGSPAEDYDRLRKLTRDLFGNYDPEDRRPEFEGLPDAAARQWAATVADFKAYFKALREERRENPGDDLVSFISTRTVDGVPWSDTYADSFLAGVAPAGHDTTAATVAGGMLGLIRFPEQLEMVKADARLIPGLVDECLRYVTPTKHFMRDVMADTTIRGTPILKGDRVMMLFISGNRDEEVYPNPDAFDVTRRPNPHLSFSAGPHICVGMHIAKLEMRILWEELLPRLGTVELAGEPRLEQSNLVSGLKYLPVRFARA
jgi:cytochrome P450